MVTTRRMTVAAVAVVALVAAAFGTQVALAQGEAGGTSDDALLERLDEAEDSLPEVLPAGIDVEEEDVWGTIQGDFGGAAASIETVADDLRGLFADADDTGGEVGDAVGNVARGWLDLGEAYDALAEWEAHDLAFPMEGTDEDGIATGADEVRGDAERGLRHVRAGQERLLAGYVSLRELGAAEDAQAQARFDARAAEVEEFDQEIAPQIHRLISVSTTMVILPDERFVTSAPGVEARARSFTVTCVDREAYVRQELDGEPGDVPGADEIIVDPDDDVERLDCPGLPEGADSGPFEGAPGDEADDPDDTDDAEDDDTDEDDEDDALE